MRKSNRAFWAAVVLAAGLLISCDKTSNNPSDGSVKNDGKSSTDIGTPPDWVTFRIAGDNAEADFSTAKEYLIVPYSVSETSGEIEFTLSLKSGSGSFGEKSFAMRLTPPSRPPLDTAFQVRWQQRLRTERWLRSLIEKAATRPHGLPGNVVTLAGGNCTQSSDCDANEVCSNKLCASQLTIKTETFSSTKTITAVVKKKGTKAAILVDSADTVSDTLLTGLLERFEGVVLPRDVALFGDPPLQGSSGVTASDRNGDGLVWLVLTSKTKEKNAVGFFVATDFTDEAASNKADILYIDANANSDEVYGICAHELQHLLNYATKVYKPTVNGGTGKPEALWLDEGQAHFAEDACGYGGENTNLLRQNVFPDFSEKSLLFAVDDVSARGMAFLYVRYLFEQKGAVKYNSDGSLTDQGGATFLQALHNSSKQGVAAVNEALGSTFTDWKAGFDNWMAAMSLDGRGLTQYARYIYQPLQIDPVTSNQIGVKIRGVRKDNTGADVTLTGPTPTDASLGDADDKVPNASGKFFSLKNQSGKITVKVTSQDKDFRFVVIRLGQ